jgi:hypothetical protein
VDLVGKVDGIMTQGTRVGCNQDDFATSVGQLKFFMDTMISMTKHFVENIVQCISVVGGVDIANNEVAKGRHLEDVTRSIDKANGNADMGLK